MAKCTTNHFRSAKSQARSVAQQLQGKNGSINSVATLHNYEQSLKMAADYIKDNHLGTLQEMTPELAQQYLSERASEVGQKTLDMDRQALQCMMQNVTNKLEENKKLIDPNTGSVIKSEIEQELESRFYTEKQVQLICDNQSKEHSLSTEIAYYGGLRAHELLTIDKIENQIADKRPSNIEKFSGIEGQKYTVKGKGGLIREIALPNKIAEKLECTKLNSPKIVFDRHIKYTSHYDLKGGQAFSAAFTRASKKALGWSTGAHGLRHSYAQERLSVLQREIPYQKALQTVSQEMGHFRSSITEVYLR